MQVKELLKSGIAEKNDLLGAAAGIARQDYNLTWPLLHVEPLVITLTFYLNSLLQQMDIFFCLFVAAAAALLTLSCAIVKWPSSAFFTYAFCLSWPPAAILPQSAIFFTLHILLLHFIRPLTPPPHSYLSQIELSLIRLLILMTVEGSQHLFL